MCLELWETELKLAQIEILLLVVLIFRLCHQRVSGSHAYSRLVECSVCIQ